MQEIRSLLRVHLPSWGARRYYLDLFRLFGLMDISRYKNNTVLKYLFRHFKFCLVIWDALLFLLRFQVTINFVLQLSLNLVEEELIIWMMLLLFDAESRLRSAL